jgi:adenosyl cobinamide kinase/adenosyl cobinamide phosphate guanylyltransferase
MSLTTLLGGARSGKSALAAEIGRRHDGPVCVVATAGRVDDDMELRIERHRQERPDGWTTIEEPIELGDAIAAADDDTLVIVDCLTLWVSNLMYAGRSDDDVRSRAASASAIAASRPGPVVAVTNEVGMGVHPDTALGRRYRDLLGWVNQTWVAESATSLLLVAGRAVELTDPWQLLDGRAATSTTSGASLR